MEHEWYFTAPWEPVSIRRGDALGLRAGADFFADLLAPGLSNATSDARWITILSWCLKRSHDAWQKAGGSDLSQSDGQRARYAWLRPLELLWVDRTLGSGQVKGKLRGRESIERWIKGDRKVPNAMNPDQFHQWWIDGVRKAPNFSMSPDQFRKYRQTGTYGAYRVIFRGFPELTTGDGWTPADKANELAKLVENWLPKLAQSRDINGKIQWSEWSKDKQDQFWIKKGWPGWREQPDKGLFPTPDTTIEKLRREERDILEPILFSEKSIRRITAKVLAGAKEATSHADLCDALANSDDLSKLIGPKSKLLSLLPAFTRFADASMHAMDGIRDKINQNKIEQGIDTKKLASELGDRLEKVQKTGKEWLKTPYISEFPHNPVITALAQVIQKESKPIKQLHALSHHHSEYGGGRRWFCEKDGKMIPLVPDKGISASYYRFRLRSLCRLAAQCGVANMNNVLNVVDKSDDDEGDNQ